MLAIAIIVVLIFGLAVFALSAWGVYAPRTIIVIVSDVMDGPSGMTIAVGVRLLLGAALIISSTGSRFPLAIVAAIAIVLIGRARLKAFVDRVAGLPDSMLRAWLVAGALFGAFLVYGAS